MKLFRFIGMACLSAILASGCTASPSPPLQVTILDVGKADAMVVQTAEHTVVIDCGEKEHGKDVTEFLEQQGISSVDYLIITHYDKDHVGGAAKVLKNMEVGTVLAPDYAEESKEMKQFKNAMDAQNLTPILLTETFAFSLDGAEFTVYPPEHPDYAENSDNNHSLVTTIHYQDTGLLFAADAMELRLEELMDIGHYDFLKVPYHGREIANLDEFLNSILPSLAAVSTSAEELQITELLDTHSIDWRATCTDGTIIVISDGEHVYFSE